MHFTPSDLVDEVMSDSPDTMRVFLAFKMGCVGCPIATFHTVDDACREHGIDREDFLRALSACGTSADAIKTGLPRAPARRA